MNNMLTPKHAQTCRDCKDFYDCGHELEQNAVVCEYFVPRYERIKQIRTVGELITHALRFKISTDKAYNDYLTSCNAY